ncbi:hypothetical protein [uncultured Jannaschia sp.]|uniref:hypothetical protein n=1 Tax=uncultured Jannaschia sp. TaxID=293347 RepID=UPI00261D8640|nr:hypothetical protein [uncultured Jannaschia sp.]
MKPTDDDIEELMTNACVSGLDDLVEMLIHDPIAEVWNQFGFLSGVSRSPRFGEHGYYAISEHTKLLCLSFQLPFDRDGRLAGCGRVVLETREEDLDARILSWDTSRAIWGELAQKIANELENLRSFDNPHGSTCQPNHRLLAALRGRVRPPYLTLIEGGATP